jgi:Spy/CpxP family protein refolding chaperone
VACSKPSTHPAAFAAAAAGENVSAAAATAAASGPSHKDGRSFSIKVPSSSRQQGLATDGSEAGV